jgi:hypothetical protein
LKQSIYKMGPHETSAASYEYPLSAIINPCHK